MRDVLWKSATNDGFEHLRLAFADGRIVADGLIVRRNSVATYRAHYIIECDERWRVRNVNIGPLTLESDGEGHWTNEPELDGCIDIDLRASPFTNTLAIERLQLQPDESREISVVFIDPGALTFERMAQRYTRLGASRTYRYESVDSGFTAELPVDEDGLLLEYPDFFVRVW
jgi:hypothetical protein